MTEEQYNILYTMILSEKSIRKITEESYNILYTMFLSQKFDSKNQ